MGGQLKTPSFLFRVAPPKLSYPTGSNDENINAHFVRSALGYLRSSTYVRDVIDWDPRPHPFYQFQPLTAFAASHGFPNFVFEPSSTLATLQWVQKISPQFATELRVLYNFGGIVSYANINERIYHIIYGWLNHATVGGDVHMLSGIDASDGIFDGITLLRVVLDSLQIVRTEDVGLQAQRFSRKITSAVFVMQPGGMRAYLGIIDQHRLALINIKRPLTDAEILGRVKHHLLGKHDAIDNVFREMRLEERKSGIETTFEMAKVQLTDAYRYDVPDSDKTEKSPPVSANFTPTLPGEDGPKKRPRGGAPSHFKKKRRKFPKGSCPNCPESTTHTINFCYKEARKKKGLPASEQWCTFHRNASHWESECSRHPQNAHLRHKNRRAAFVQAEVQKQIKAMIAQPRQSPINVKRPSPPRTAPLALSDQDHAGPPPDYTNADQEATAKKIHALISRLGNAGKSKLRDLLKS